MGSKYRYNIYKLRNNIYNANIFPITEMNVIWYLDIASMCTLRRKIEVSVFLCILNNCSNKFLIVYLHIWKTEWHVCVRICTSRYSLLQTPYARDWGKEFVTSTGLKYWDVLCDTFNNYEVIFSNMATSHTHRLLPLLLIWTHLLFSCREWCAMSRAAGKYSQVQDIWQLTRAGTKELENMSAIGQIVGWYSKPKGNCSDIRGHTPERSHLNVTFVRSASPN
jgi:hypothetical protein